MTIDRQDKSRQALAEVAIRLDGSDQVAIARFDLPAGLRIAVQNSQEPFTELTVREPVSAGHKVAIYGIRAGETVRRYGQPIGLATREIAPGEWVHTHNLGADPLAREVAFGTDVRPVEYVPEAERRFFLGYRRPDGQVGTRNYVAVISTVNCSAHASREIARYFTPECLAAYPNVDGVIALTHSLGCPLEQVFLQRTLAGMARHPNVGGYLLVGLGCETNQMSMLMERYGLARDSRVRGNDEGRRGNDEGRRGNDEGRRGNDEGRRGNDEGRRGNDEGRRGDDIGRRGNDEKQAGPTPALAIQDLGGIRKTVLAGIRAVEEMLPAVNATPRTLCPVSELRLALQCGGSDSWSGVTANPVVGLVSDEIVRQGGTVVLAETPEIYGAEHLLTRRAASPEVGQRLVEQVQWWEGYARRMGFDLDDNRSTGNAAGGLTTIFEKSLGAVAKGGSTPLSAVYDYAEQVTGRGLAFMNSPGFDPVSVTGQVAGGCNLVLFTTGRGSVLGFKPAPCIKVSSNSAMYAHMIEDMDLDAGRVLAGVPLEEVAADLLALVLAVASGQPSKSEAQGVGEAEFCPWNPEGTL
jgi:altronate hydrolase